MLLITDKFGFYIIFIMFFIALFYFSLYISINLLIGFFKAVNDKLYMTSYDLVWHLIELLLQEKATKSDDKSQDED